MKTTNKLTALVLLSALSFSSVIKADEINLPVINKPAVLDEGTQTELTAAQIAELLPWAKDSKIFLIDLLENVQGLSMTDKIERLVEGIKSVVGESAPKNSELLMRYALNRGLVVNDIITREALDTSVGTADAKLRVLRASIQMAIKYYDTDMAILSEKNPAPYVLFGADYFDFLSDLNKSVFDASAQYAIQRTALEWLQWDLYRDLNNASYSPQIVKINSSLKTFPDKRLEDAQSIASIRQMKSVARQLSLNLRKKNPNNTLSEKAFETFMIKKTLVDTIQEDVVLAKASMDYVSTVEEFFRAFTPDGAKPSPEYIAALSRAAFDNRIVLINFPSTTASDIQRLNLFVNDVDRIITLTQDYLVKVKTIQEFLKLFEFCVSSPSESYKIKLKKLTLKNLGQFMNMNPTQNEIDLLLSKFKL